MTEDEKQHQEMVDKIITRIEKELLKTAKTEQQKKAKSDWFKKHVIVLGK